MVSLCPYAFAASDSYDYLVEAEAFTASNFAVEGGSRVTDDANLSGGKLLNLYTKNTGGHYAEYNVTVATTGVYNLFLASSPVHEAGWSSKIYISVNGGAETGLRGKLLSSTANDRIKWYDVGGITLKAGANTIKFAVNESVASGYYAAFIDCFGLNMSSLSARYLDSAAPMNVFEADDEIAISVYTNAEAPADATFAYSLKDVHQNVIKTGNVVVKSGDSKADIVFEDLKLGHYMLEVANLKCGFSVVKPLAQRTRYEDTPFATDTAFTGVYDNGINAEDYAKVVGLSGVSWSRDRLRMKDYVTYSNGQYSFNSSRPKAIAELLAPYGVKTSSNAEYMPSNFKNDYGTYIPDDLIETYNFWKAMSAYYGNAVDNWEILNEVDLGGTVSAWDSPDLYAAFMKAAAVGINDGSNAMTSVQGAAAPINHNSEYGKMLLRNDVLDYSAFDNTHSHIAATTPYAGYLEFPGKDNVANIASAQNALAEKAPIWVTESGIAITSESGVDLTQEQQLVQAKYLVTSNIESIASGTDKHFFFIGPKYHEGEMSWGMMSEDAFNPYMYASLPAQSAMTDILGKGIYKGKIGRFGNNLMAYLFNNGTKNVIVAWSKSGEQNVTFNASGKAYDMWGNEIADVNDSVSLAIGTEPVYIVCDSCSENAESTRGAQLTAQKKTINDAKRVILLQKYDDISRGGSRTEGYMISGNTTVTLEVANLSDKTMTGRIGYETENGWMLDEEYQDVTVAPMSVETLEFTIIPAIGATTDYLSFVGTFDGQKTSASTVKLVNTKDGIIKIEAETDAKSQNGFTEYTKDGNAGLGIYTSTAGKYEIEFEFVADKSGVYDLWALAGVLNNSTNSNYTIKVNSKKLAPSAKNTAEVSYTGSNYSVGWDAFNDVSLNKGINKVTFSVSDGRNNGDGWISSALDKLVFIPKNANGWTEAENYTTKKGLFYTQTNATASAGTVAKLFTYGISNPIKDNEMTYDFAVNQTGKYDVWVLSARANVSWLTKWKIGLDGSVDYPDPVSEKTTNITIDGQEMYWYKINQNVTLNRGIHSITIRGDEERANNDGKYMFHIADAIVVVPGETYSWYRWNPTKNVASDKLGIIQKTLFNEYDLANITENIYLPTKIDNVDISWSSSNPSVISAYGVVNRPEQNASDASVKLTASMKLGGSTKTASYNLTVKKHTEERKPELWATLEKTEDGYSDIRVFGKNTDVLADENGNMPAAIVAKYDKETDRFIGFIGDIKNTYTNSANDTFIVDRNKVTCHITGANANSIVTFAVYKEGTKPGSETVAYVNEYYPTADNSEIDFTFETDKGEAAYRVVINKNGESISKIIHIFEEQVLIFDENDTQDDIWVKQGIGQRLTSTKAEAEMPSWHFPTPENEDVVYKMFIWEWYSMKPLFEGITLY